MVETATAAAGVAAAYDREGVIARAAGEPDWLAQQRLAAWDVWAATPLPTTRQEEWRYTDPRRLKWDAVRLADPAPGPAAAVGSAATQGSAAGRVIQAGGGLAAVELDADLVERGVLLLDLRAAAVRYPDLVREHLGALAAPEAGKFVALNSAFWSAGVLLHVPRGVRIERPIRIVRWVGEAGRAYFPRTLVVAGEGSHVAVVEQYISPDFEKPVFSCGVVELVAGAAADVHYVAMQQWGRGVHHLSTQRTVAGRDANLDTLVVNLGGSVARIDLAAALRGPGSRSDMLGLYFGGGDQHFDHVTRQDHEVPYASSDLLYKGALDGRSHSVFRGIIKVWPGAQRTDAYQTNRNLLLSRESEATSLPNLEIEADDVRCSHAATVGHLDDEELFYIRSRGIPRREAERLVVFGFFGEVIDRLPLPEVVEELRRAIETRIG